MRFLGAWLGPGPALEPRAHSLSSTGTCTRSCGVNRLRACSRTSGDHAWKGTCRQGKLCEAPVEEAGVWMQRPLAKRTNWTKFAKIRVKFVRNSKFTEKSIFTHLPSTFVRTKFIRISYQFIKNVVQFVNKASKPTNLHRAHTLQSHGQLIDHAPAFVHLGGRHAETVLSRCQSVVGRTGGATPEMAKRIPDSA